MEQFLPIGCCCSAFREAARVYLWSCKNYESGLLNSRQCCYFMIVAILLAFVHECKPDSRQPLAEVGMSHGHLCRSRPSCSNKDAFGRNASIPIITSYIDLGRVCFSFAFFNMAMRKMSVWRENPRKNSVSRARIILPPSTYPMPGVGRLVPLGSRCRATPKRRNPRRSMAPRKHQAHPGAVPFPHHESQVKPRRVDPLTEWRGNRIHSFPPGMYSVNRTPRMDVETEPIHFTQDDHHSIQGTNSWCPHRFPDSSDYRRRRSKKGVESLSHLFSDPRPYGAQLGP